MANKSLLTKEMVSTLEGLAEIDATVTEMAYVCDVSRETIYSWFKKDKKLADRIERLRAKPLFRVRKAINEKATESYANAMDYAKRKAPTEFGDKANVVLIAPKPLLDILHVEAKEVPIKEIKSDKEVD